MQLSLSDQSLVRKPAFRNVANAFICDVRRDLAQPHRVRQQPNPRRRHPGHVRRPHGRNLPPQWREVVARPAVLAASPPLQSFNLLVLAHDTIRDVHAVLE